MIVEVEIAETRSKAIQLEICNDDERTVTRTYQQIIKEATAQSIAGVKTPRRAIANTVYRWRQHGLNLSLVDKGGHHWGLGAYARLVVGMTTQRAYQAVRDQAADDYGIDIFLMTSHPAARPACAPIQGKLVTTRAAGFVAQPTGEQVYALVNYGYGTPGGTFGINCRHQKWAYVPGVNTNNQTQYKPDEAVKNSDIQQRQRALERQVRKYKQERDLAQQLGDEDGLRKYSALIRNNQASIRSLVKEHDFLQRDYSREKYYNNLSQSYVKDIRKQRLARNDERVSNIVFSSHKRNVTSSQQKQAALSAYASFKRDGIVLSDHAVVQYQNRQRHEKTGKIIFNYSQVLDAIKRPGNFEGNGRLIHFYNGIVAVTEKDEFNTVVTIYHAHKPKKRWKKID